MALNELQKSAQKAVAVGMMFVTVGMMMIVFGILWPHFPGLANLWPSHNDFLRGFVFGFAISMEIAGVAINARAAVATSKCKAP